MTRDWDLRANALAASAIADGEPTAWFDRLYAEGAAGEVSMPWDRDQAQALFAAWYADAAPAPGRAIVVGCGLGADAEFLSERGWQVTAFDVAPTAIDQARLRHPGSSVDYRVEDLLALSTDLIGGFDLVVEVFTLQALPDPPRAEAAAGVASLTAPGGTIVAVAFCSDGEPASDHPPYPLDAEDLWLLAVRGVEVVAMSETDDGRWLAELRRPA